MARHAKKSTAKPVVMILNTPNNPTGQAIEESELKKLAESARKNNVIVISDEIYALTMYPGEEHHSMAKVRRDAMFVLLFGFLRMYAVLVHSGDVRSPAHGDYGACLCVTHVSLQYYPEGTIVTSGLSKWCGAGGWYVCFGATACSFHR